MTAATVKDISTEWDLDNDRRSLLIHGCYQAYSNIWTFGKYKGADKLGHDGVLLLHPDTPKETINAIKLMYLKCANEANGKIKKFDQIHQPKIAEKVFDGVTYTGIFWGSSADNYPSIVNGMEAIDNSDQMIANMKAAIAKGCMLNVKISFNGDSVSAKPDTKVWVT